MLDDLIQKFQSDLKQEISNVLSDVNIKIADKDKFSDYLTDYLTLEKKFINAVPRKVLISPVLLDKLNKSDKKSEILTLKRLFENGDNINQFQSDRVKQSNFHDHLLYEWNIYHFHLSFKINKKNNFAKRTNKLLFVYITDIQAIFLDTDIHRDGIFGDKRWIEILHDFFPKEIEQFKDLRIKEVEPNLSNTERQDLWNKGYTLGMITIRDTVYHSPGIGRMTSGHSVIVMKTVDEVTRWIYNIAEQIIDNIDGLSNYFNISISKLDFSMRFGMNTFELVENKTRQIVLEYPETINTDKL